MRFGLLLLLACLTACGFQLQGSHRWPEEWPGYRIDYSMRQAGMYRFSQQLDKALQYRGLKPNADPAFQIRLLGLRDSKSVAAIGSDGKAVEYELRQAIDFQIVAHQQPSAIFTLSEYRRLSFDPADVLAKEVEEARLRQALSRELIELMILRAESELRSHHSAG
ncbi:MAG: LPS assembly lipoprotein LptE [Oceanococcus sp.]